MSRNHKRVPARLNPYATHRLHALVFRQTGFSWTQTLNSLTDMAFTASIIGAKGSGKTTFLGELTTKLDQLGHQTLAIQLRTEHIDPFAETKRHLDAGCDREAIILLDGAEQLGFWAWRRFLSATRHRKGLIITTHRAGRLATLLECGTTLQLLEDLVSELDPGHDDSTLLHELFDLNNGNIRLCLRALYDRVYPATIDGALASHPAEM